MGGVVGLRPQRANNFPEEINTNQTNIAVGVLWVFLTFYGWIVDTPIYIVGGNP